ncbi:WD40/YVTN/BNR-like repeat-containing protein, partial [candidate division KSB1 bacterium]
HHISEVVVHPKDPDIVYVAAQGHLWGHGGDMGIFKTTDGGLTWENLTNGLPNDGKTGASDLKMDPKNSNTLYAGLWERLRQPHRFDSGGPNSGIYKSTNGGKSWKKLTKGLPTGDIGKIGIAIYRKNPKILMAMVEAERSPDLSVPGSGVYRSENGGDSWTYVNTSNSRPFYYSHIWINPLDDQRVIMLDGSGRISDDGGTTFSRSMPGISGDFHALWNDPTNKDRFYVGNDKGAYITHDYGYTFTMFDDIDISQFYAVTVDNRDPYYVYGGLQDNGNWGGPSNSRDENGILSDHWYKFHSGDGFHTTVDPNDWRTVYTESQGGNIRRLDAVFRQLGNSITPRPQNILNFEEYFPDIQGNRSPREIRFNWSAPIILSPHNSNTVYFAGNYVFKSTDRGDTWWLISGDLTTNNPERAYPEGSGGLSPENTGAEQNNTLITISESPITPGLIWVCGDDGTIQLTRNDGKVWENVRNNIRGVPIDLWVSRVEASHFDEGTAYVSFDGHRSDNFQPWVFKTTDYGRSWTNISGNLPDGQVVYVVKEDLKNPNLLFVGTEFAVFATVNGGRSWDRLMGDMPTVAVHDLVIHPRDGDLIAATHGRGIRILDDITPLQQFTSEVMNSNAYLFDSKVATLWQGVTRGATRGHKFFAGRNPLTMSQSPPSNSPSGIRNSAAIHYYLRNENSGEVKLEITDMQGENRFEATVPGTAGINRYYWNLRFSPPPPTPEQQAAQQQRAGRAGRGGFGGRGGASAGAGTYIVKLTVNGQTYTKTLTVRDDPMLDPTRK